MDGTKAQRTYSSFLLADSRLRMFSKSKTCAGSSLWTSSMNMLGIPDSNSPGLGCSLRLKILCKSSFQRKSLQGPPSWSTWGSATRTKTLTTFISVEWSQVVLNSRLCKCWTLVFRTWIWGISECLLGCWAELRQSTLTSGTSQPLNNRETRVAYSDSKICKQNRKAGKFAVPLISPPQCRRADPAPSKLSSRSQGSGKITKHAMQVVKNHENKSLIKCPNSWLTTWCDPSMGAPRWCTCYALIDWPHHGKKLGTQSFKASKGTSTLSTTLLELLSFRSSNMQKQELLILQFCWRVPNMLPYPKTSIWCATICCRSSDRPSFRVQPFKCFRRRGGDSVTGVRAS